MLMNKKSLKLYLSCLCLALLFGSSAVAQQVATLRAVEFEGNRYFSQRKLIAWSGLKPGQPYREDLVESAVQKVLQRLAFEGFYFSSIDSMGEDWTEDSTRVSLKFYVHEGDRLILKDLTVEGDTAETEEELLLMTEPGRRVYADALQADLWDILGAKEEEGHPFARLDVKKLPLQGDSLTVKTRMIPGPLAHIQAIRIAGLENTKPRVVAREARVVPGEIYRPSRVQKARSRIRKLAFIDEVSEPALIPLGSGDYDLLFTVKEARSNSFDGVIGYQPAAGQEKGEVTGLLDLTFMNLFGTGRKAKVHWERLNRFQQALDLFYEEPWVAGLPFNLWAEFHQEILDTLYLTRKISGGAVWPALDVLSLKGSVFQEQVLPDSIGRATLGLYSSRSLGGALELEYDTRDFPDNPTAGLYYRSFVSAAQKNYESAAPQDDIDVRRYESDVNWSQRVIGRQILNLQFHGRLLQSDEKPIPQPDLYRLGGSRTLRGYREDQFLGQTIGWGSVEYRLWLDSLSRIYAFFNLGYYEYEPSTGQGITKDWPWGYGVGFRQGTRLGIIGFDFALGESDVLATAKVHFRLINRF